MDEVRERIKIALRLKGIKVNSLAERGSSIQHKLQRQINEGKDITLDTLLVIIEQMKDVDLNWLLRGVGTDPFGTIESKVDYASILLSDIKDRK